MKRRACAHGWMLKKTAPGLFTAKTSRLMGQIASLSTGNVPSASPSSMHIASILMSTHIFVYFFSQHHASLRTPHAKHACESIDGGVHSDTHAVLTKPSI